MLYRYKLLYFMIQRRKYFVWTYLTKMVKYLRYWNPVLNHAANELGQKRDLNFHVF